MRTPRRIPPALIGLLWISPWLIGFVVFMALPLGMSFYYSLTDYPLLEPPLYVGAENYRALLSDPIFMTVLRNTAVYALISIPLQIVLSVGIAALLNNKVRFVGAYRAAVFIPFIVPIVAQAMIWYWLLNADFGLINQVLGLIGIRGPNWLGDRNWALPAMVIVSLWNVGQAVVINLAALQDVPKQLYEAAALDGAGPLRRLWSVTLPGISPIILFNVIAAIMVTWQVFAVPYIMTEGGPDRSTYFYTMYLFDSAFVFRKMGYASALAWIQCLVMLGLTGLLILVSRKSVHYAAA